MGMIIAVSTRKGGAAKTSTAAQLSAELALLGYRVLAVDLDGQPALTDSFLSPEQKQQELNPDLSTYRLFMEPESGWRTLAWDIDLSFDSRVPGEGGRPARQRYIVNDLLKIAPERRWRPGGGHLSLLPGHVALEGIDREIYRQGIQDSPFGGPRAMVVEVEELRLGRALEGVRDVYDFVILDTPPASQLTMNSALRCADWLLIPLQLDAFSMHAYRRMDTLMKEVNAARRHEVKLRLLGGVLVMYRDPVVTQQMVAQQFYEQLGPRILHTKVPFDDAVIDAALWCVPVQLGYPNTPIARAVHLLAREVIERVAA